MFFQINKINQMNQLDQMNQLKSIWHITYHSCYKDKEGN